jgi:hypothetical protein
MLIRYQIILGSPGLSHTGPRMADICLCQPSCWCSPDNLLFPIVSHRCASARWLTASFPSPVECQPMDSTCPSTSTLCLALTAEIGFHRPVSGRTRESSEHLSPESGMHMSGPHKHVSCNSFQGACFLLFFFCKLDFCLSSCLFASFLLSLMLRADP